MLNETADIFHDEGAQVLARNCEISRQAGKIVSRGWFPGPVISAVRRERPEDRSSLLEPIFHGRTLAESLSSVPAGIYLAPTPRRIPTWAALYIHAGTARDTHGGLVAWWRSRWKNGRFHMNAFHANAPHRRPWGKLEEASRGQEQPAEPSTEYRAPSTQV